MSNSRDEGRICLQLGLLVALCSFVGAGAAQTLSGMALIEALQGGGYFIAMRHASAPTAPPNAESARAGNVDGERQLDEVGLATAAAMGEALRELDIPVGEILSSPTFRAIETVQQLGFAAVETQTFPELESRGRDTEWLRMRVTSVPPAGGNSIIVTHSTNLADAFGEAASGIAEGEALILRPGGDSFDVVARFPIMAWPELATREREISR